ncbi:MAG: hypothetical protein ACR2K2_11235 [Mycobacteriales bacterium]
MTTSPHTSSPDSPPVTAPASRPRAPYATALLWGDAGILAGVAAAVLLALPFYPADDKGWAALGWALAAAALAAVLGLAAGSLALARGLRRCGAAHPAATALTFVPVALLLGAFTAALGSLAAPALAHWLVEGFTRRGAARQVGYGPAGHRPAGGSRRSGLAQRVVLALVACGLATAYILDSAGHRYGGEVHGELAVWALCLPVLVLVPVLLLRTRLPLPVLAGGIAALAALTALAVPGSVESAHPSQARLERLADDLPVPAGQLVLARASWLAPNSITDTPLPVRVLLTAPANGAVPDLPPALLGAGPRDVPGLPGRRPADRAAQPLPGTARGEAAADAWERVLVTEGWAVDEYSTPQYGSSGGDSYWLPTAAQSVLDSPGRVHYERGPWIRASVVPYGDGALVVLSTRP